MREDEEKGAEIIGYVKNVKTVGRRERENGKSKSFGGAAATVELRKFRALQQSVSLSTAAPRCGAEFQS